MLAFELAARFPLLLLEENLKDPLSEDLDSYINGDADSCSDDMSMYRSVIEVPVI